MQQWMCTVPSAQGAIAVTGEGDLILKISFEKKLVQKGKILNTLVEQKVKEVEEYLEGKRTTFASCACVPTGTPFQQAVWKACANIPYGETRTYAQIAAAIKKPKAVRAVGTALAKNPVCIVIPCHRVVPKSGGIGNYAYGAKRKAWLLALEQGEQGKMRGGKL